MEISTGFKYICIEGGLTCQFSKTTVVGSPIGPMTFPSMASGYIYSQQVSIPSLGSIGYFYNTYTTIVTIDTSFLSRSLLKHIHVWVSLLIFFHQQAPQHHLVPYESQIAGREFPGQFQLGFFMSYKVYHVFSNMILLCNSYFSFDQQIIIVFVYGAQSVITALVYNL